MKYRFFLFFLIFSFQQPFLKALPPEAPKYIAGACFLFPIIGQIEWEILDEIDGRPGGWLTSSAFAQTIAAGSIMAAIAYYISKSYTPKKVYGWALGLEEKAQKLLSFNKNFSIEDGSGLITSHIDALYSLHAQIESAKSYLKNAPEDLPGDIIFEDDCKQLSDRLSNYTKTIEKKGREYCNDFVRIYSHRTSSPVGTTYSIVYNSKYEASIRWALSLKGFRNPYYHLVL